MELAHDTEHALATIVDLVNTRAAEAGAVDGGTERPHADGLADLAALASLVERREISEAGALTGDDLAAVRRLRERLHAVFLAPDEATAVELVNRLVADGRTTPRLTDHDGWPLHIHYYAPGARLAEHLAADCGMALAFVLAVRRAGPAGRLRRPGLRAGAGRPVAQPLEALLRQPHLRQPAARRRLPRPPEDQLAPASTAQESSSRGMPWPRQCDVRPARGAWVPSSIGTRMPTSRAAASAIS